MPSQKVFIGHVKGDTGATPKITATAEEVASTEDVAVEQTGTPEEPNLTFKIPKGATGATPHFTVSSETGVAGSDVSVEQGGTDTEPTLKFTIPKGEKGDSIATHWDVSVTATGWTATTETKPTFAGLTAGFQNTVSSLAGMTAETDISGIVFTGGDRASAATWAWLAPSEGSVTLYAVTKPTADFTLRLTEVK